MARKPKSPKDYPTRRDEEAEDEQQTSGRGPSAIRSLLTPVFPGIRNIWRRFGGQKPPRVDPTKAQVWYRPSLRAVEWEGEADLHTEQECILPHCNNPGERGHHSEMRPDGFDWCGRHFSCLTEALENQAFTRWYKEGYFEGEFGERGEDVMAKGKMVLRPALYPRNEEPPLPEYNFFLNEHIDEMTRQEIMEYQRDGTVPVRLRRRGRTKKR